MLAEPIPLQVIPADVCYSNECCLPWEGEMTFVQVYRHQFVLKMQV